MQNWKTSDFQQVLGFNGYTRSRTRGDHIVYGKLGCKPISITAKELNACIARNLIKQNNLIIPDKLCGRYVV